MSASPSRPLSSMQKLKALLASGGTGSLRVRKDFLELAGGIAAAALLQYIARRTAAMSKFDWVTLTDETLWTQCGLAPEEYDTLIDRLEQAHLVHTHVTNRKLVALTQKLVRELYQD